MGSSPVAPARVQAVFALGGVVVVPHYCPKRQSSSSFHSRIRSSTRVGRPVLFRPGPTRNTGRQRRRVLGAAVLVVRRGTLHRLCDQQLRRLRIAAKNSSKARWYRSMKSFSSGAAIPIERRLTGPLAKGSRGGWYRSESSPGRPQCYSPHLPPLVLPVQPAGSHSSLPKRGTGGLE